MPPVMNFHAPVITRNILLKSIDLLAALILTLAVTVAGVIFNAYLASNNYGFYAKGTKDKAFLNARWKMTPKEIGRANHTTLVPSDDRFEYDIGPDVIDAKRFKDMVQKDISLYGHPVEIQYSFFDNMLLEYCILMTVYDKDKPYKEIVANLTEKYGKPTINLWNTENWISNLDWGSEKQKVSCWLGKYDEKRQSYYVGIRARYIPLDEEIKNVAKAEKKKYF